MEALKDRRMVAISGGWRHTAAADDAGNLLTWGWNKASCSFCSVAPAPLAVCWLSAGFVGQSVPHIAPPVLQEELCLAS